MVQLQPVTEKNRTSPIWYSTTAANHSPDNSLPAIIKWWTEGRSHNNNNNEIETNELVWKPRNHAEYRPPCKLWLAQCWLLEHWKMAWHGMAVTCEVVGWSSLAQTNDRRLSAVASVLLWYVKGRLTTWRWLEHHSCVHQLWGLILRCLWWWH